MLRACLSLFPAQVGLEGSTPSARPLRLVVFLLSHCYKQPADSKRTVRTRLEGSLEAGPKRSHPREQGPPVGPSSAVAPLGRLGLSKSKGLRAF